MEVVEGVVYQNFGSIIGEKVMDHKCVYIYGGSCSEPKLRFQHGILMVL